MMSLRDIYQLAPLLLVLVIPARNASLGGQEAGGSVVSVTRQEPTLRHIDLAGPWRYLPSNSGASFAAPGTDDSSWPTMRLPSNWFLLGSDRYPQNSDRTETPGGPGQLWPIDPDFGLDWSGTVWFRREVDWNPTAGRTVVLDLDMVDYYTEVFVNGVQVGAHEGYFQKWSLDVSRAIRAGRNSIALKISAPALPFDMSARFPISWPKQQNQVKGIFAYHDTRPGATSARGQERSTGGVIRGLALRESHGIELVGMQVTSPVVTDSSAKLVVEAVIRNWTATTTRVTVAGSITAKNFQSWSSFPVKMAVDAAPGITRVRSDVWIGEPRLWWSWDHGKPNLYRLKARLTGPELLDSAATTFGIRSISRDSNWVWRLNGRRFYPRGTNYIATQWMSQADARWYARDVQMMIAANLNTVRVHAHLARPEFYEATDSAGLMVWQDFPLQWGYTDEPAFHAEALRQTGDMVDRFGGHVSIIAWSMHNESPHAMEWMEKRDPKQNLELDNSLVALIRRLDPTRVHHRDSGTGDGHPYPGWYGGKVDDYIKLPKEPFISEYGAQALPNIESLRATFPSDRVFPDTAKDWANWRFHDFQPRETLEIAGVSRGNTIEQFIENSQRYQSRVIRYGTEIFRRAKWKGNTGIYQFMFVDDWPSITWSVVDYYRRTKSGYQALAGSMQPLLASIEYRIGDRDHPISIHIVNDGHTSLPGAVLKWRVVAADARPAEAESRPVDVPADGVVKVVELGPMPAVTRGGSRLEAWVEHNGQVLGRSTLDAADFQ